MVEGLFYSTLMPQTVLFYRKQHSESAQNLLSESCYALIESS